MELARRALLPAHQQHQRQQPGGQSSGSQVSVGGPGRPAGLCVGRHGALVHGEVPGCRFSGLLDAGCTATWEAVPRAQRMRDRYGCRCAVLLIPAGPSRHAHAGHDKHAEPAVLSICLNTSHQHWPPAQPTGGLTGLGSGMKKGLHPVLRTATYVLRDGSSVQVPTVFRHKAPYFSQLARPLRA